MATRSRKTSGETPAQKSTVHRVMEAHKEGKLRSGGSGRKVTSRKQAIAIALSEAGESRDKTPAENARTRRKTAAKKSTRKRTTAKRT